LIPIHLTDRINKFARKAGKAIHRYKMIKNGDKILIGVSGGKDSLCLTLTLKQRQKWVPINYQLFAVFIEWREYPVTQEKKQALKAFFSGLEVPLKLIKRSMHTPSFHDDFNCYLCSRNKKRILFEQANQLGITKIALGHHMDDMVETTLLNLFYRGSFATMMPVQEFFNGKIQIIRPLCEVYENDINKLTRLLNLPLVSIACPGKQANQRLLIKEIIKKLSRVNKKVRENIYRAPWRINQKYLPTCLNQ
jgi:tRNA 2-thiocytidine biosynthesis protein TtcA